MHTDKKKITFEQYSIRLILHVIIIFVFLGDCCKAFLHAAVMLLPGEVECLEIRTSYHLVCYFFQIGVGNGATCTVI